MHLVRRFLQSLVARDLSPDEDAWVGERLTAGEYALWARQAKYDRRHTYEVARRVEADLGRSGDEVGHEWTAAALLHDVGKIEAGVGLVGRVVATLLAMPLGRERVSAWAGRGGVAGRLGRYLDHGPRGAALIRAAGGRERVAHWASIHHGVDRRRGDPAGIVPQRAVRALKDADRD